MHTGRENSVFGFDMPCSFTLIGAFGNKGKEIVSPAECSSICYTFNPKVERLSVTSVIEMKVKQKAALAECLLIIT